MKQNIGKLLVIFIAAFSTTSFLPEQPSVGKVSFPLNNVLVLSQGETRFQKATFNMPVKNGDKIDFKAVVGGIVPVVGN